MDARLPPTRWFSDETLSNEECDRLYQTAKQCELHCLLPPSESNDVVGCLVWGSQDKRSGQRNIYLVTAFLFSGIEQAPFTCSCQRAVFLCKHIVAAALDLAHRLRPHDRTENSPRQLFCLAFESWVEQHAPRLKKLWG